MYVTVRDRPVAAEGTTQDRTRRRFRTVGPVVLALGMTSLLIDMSTEMVNAVLPLYLVLQLGYSPLQFGFVNGLYQGATAVVRLAGGAVSDRWGRYKEVAGVGYGLSALSRIGLLAAGSAGGLVTMSLVADRIGKGIRTAPRDAMLSMSARPGSLGLVFGVHRTMDTFGALLGPFAAFAVLAFAPGGYDLVFVVSTGVAILGVASLVLLVDTRRKPATGETGTARSEDPAEPAEPRLRRPARTLLRDRRLRLLTIAAVVLSLATVGDAFVYLRLQNGLDLSATQFPLLPAGMNVCYLLLAIPFGHLADRRGRVPVLLGGYVALVGVYALLLGSGPGVGVLIASLVLLGAFYAATDGVMAALTSAIVRRSARTSGLAVVQAGVALAQFASSTLFGLLWTVWGASTAFLIAGIALIVGLGVAGVLLARARMGNVLTPAGGVA